MKFFSNLKIKSQKSYVNFQKSSVWKLLSDWRFVYKLVTFIFVALCLILGIIYGAFIEFWYVNPEQFKKVLRLPRTYNLNVLASFWSTQTNFILCLFFFFLLLYHNKETTNKFTSLNSQISVTIYITVTMLLFWSLVFYGLGSSQTYNFASTMEKWLGTIMHAVTPLLALVYLILSLGKSEISYRKYFQKQVFYMLGYPIVYLIFVNLRAQLLYPDLLPVYGERAKSALFIFPYDFVNFYKPLFPIPLVWNNILLVVLGITLLIGINIIIIFGNNIAVKYFLKKSKNI